MGQLASRRHALYVCRTRTSLGRAARTAYRVVHHRWRSCSSTHSTPHRTRAAARSDSAPICQRQSELAAHGLRRPPACARQPCGLRSRAWARECRPRAPQRHRPRHRPRHRLGTGQAPAEAPSDHALRSAIQAREEADAARLSLRRRRRRRRYDEPKGAGRAAYGRARQPAVEGMHMHMHMHMPCTCYAHAMHVPCCAADHCYLVITPL